MFLGLVSFRARVFRARVRIPSVIHQYKLVRVRDYRNINHDDLLHDLYKQFCLSDFSTTMETAIDRCNNSIRSVIDKHAPAKLKRIKNVPSCPWFNQAYLLLRRKKRKAERMFKKSKLFMHKLTYYDLRKQCIDLAKQKLKYFLGKIKIRPDTRKPHSVLYCKVIVCC